MENKYYLLEIVFEDEDRMQVGVFDNREKLDEVIAEFEQIKMKLDEDIQKRVAGGEDIEKIVIDSYLNGDQIYLLSEGFSIREFEINVNHIPLFIKSFTEKNI